MQVRNKPAVKNMPNSPASSSSGRGCPVLGSLIRSSCAATLQSMSSTGPLSFACMHPAASFTFTGGIHDTALQRQAEVLRIQQTVIPQGLWEAQVISQAVILTGIHPRAIVRAGVDVLECTSLTRSCMADLKHLNWRAPWRTSGRQIRYRLRGSIQRNVSSSSAADAPFPHLNSAELLLLRPHTHQDRHLYS
jgi:hypothetical protein